MAVRNTCVVEEAKDAGHAPLQLGGGGLKTSEKSLLGSQKFLFWCVGGGGGSEIFILVCGWAGGSEIFIWCVCGGGGFIIGGGGYFFGGVT